MSHLKATYKAIAIGTHVLAAIALVLLFLKTGGMTLFCVVPGVLIGCASVAARPGRPVTLYAAFGVLMGYAFWMAVSAVNQHDVLSLVPVALVVVGAAWLLQTPRWPSALFTAVAVLLSLGLAVLQYRHRHDVGGFDPEQVRRGALTSLVVLALGLVYLGLGFAEATLQEPRQRPRAVRRRERPRADETE
jgi:hypothetical protein